MARRCAECGSVGRMEGRPADSDLCTVCGGEQRHAFDVAKDPQSRWTYHKGYYNDWPAIEDVRRQPGQGAGHG